MASKKDRDEQAAEVPEAPEAKMQSEGGVAMTAPTGKRPKIAGKLSKPLYLIHHGKFESTIPAVTREVVITDPDAEDFGSVVTETVVDEYDVKGTLPKGTKYGSRRIGVAHEIWDAAEAEALKAKGFVEATKAELEHSTKESAAAAGIDTDELAMRERERAIKRFNASTIGKRVPDASRD